MTKKLLVITAGTVAAGVGLEIQRQMRAHPKSELQVMVRCIDTAYLPSRYGTLAPGEWFQMSIERRYMDAIYKKIKNFQRIEAMLFPGLLPATDTSGGGSIRYNGAGAVEIQRNNLREWLSDSMATLARSGKGETTISMALIVSAVGATGSGSLERLIEIIVDAANYANIKSTAQSTVRCDVFILQPGIQKITDLGLANTLALYAELAASQLSLTSNHVKSYQGRNIMIGWGSSRALSSIEQLKEAAATLIRLTTDPASAFAAEFQEREVDNHVLRELDPISNLPMHLSLATAVTVSLGSLEEQIIDRDIDRLVDSLVFAKTASGAQPNILLGKFAEALAGETSEDIYNHLCDYLSEVLDPDRMNTRVDTTLRNRKTSAKERASKLSSALQEYRNEIKQGQQRIQHHGDTFIDDAIRAMEQTQRERICRGGISLTELREEFRALQNLLNSTLKVAREDIRTTVDNTAVTRQQKALDVAWPASLINRDTKLKQLSNAIKTNLQEHLRQTARPTALLVLETLENHCAEIGRNLDIVLQKLSKQKKNRRDWVAADREYNVDMGHPLQFVAISNSKDRKEVDEYAAKVSVFAPRMAGVTGSATRAQDNAQLAEFRLWLEGNEDLDALFKGDLELLLKVVRSYTTEKVHEEIEHHSVIDVLLQAGDGILEQRFKEAATMAISLVSYSKSFAPFLREAWHVSAYYRTSDQREAIDKAIRQSFAEGQCRLLESKDPTEIAIFYYVDGIPMSAVDDLKGRCLNAFLNRRQQWRRQQLSLNISTPVASIGSFNQRVGVPVYSGQDATDRVQETCVIQRLYEVKGQEVDDYAVEDIPELGCEPLGVPDNQENHARMNGHSAPVDPDGESILATQKEQVVSASMPAQANGNSHGGQSDSHQPSEQAADSPQPLQNGQDQNSSTNEAGS